MAPKKKAASKSNGKNKLVGGSGDDTPLPDLKGGGGTGGKAGKGGKKK
jgi:hypothetical protein